VDVLDYRVITKGRGHVYQHADQLYKRVKTEGETRSALVLGCDGSAKLVGDQFYLGVSSLCLCLCVK